MNKHFSAVPGKGAKKRIMLMLILAILACLFMASPWGITKYQLQNRMFSIEDMSVRQTETGVRVEALVAVRNWFPWRVRFDDVFFKGMGEYNTVLSNLNVTPMPFSLEFLEKKDLSLNFSVDDGMFFTEYVSDYADGADAETGRALERFIRDVGFVFHADAVPTGEALCLKWE